MSVDLKAATPDTTIPATGAFLFGADSQSASAPSVYRIDTTILQYLDSLAHTITVNGALSAPATSLTGTWITGGSATTTKPHFLVEPSGTTSTGWSTAGTGIGVNAPSGFTGNLIDAQLNGVSKARIDYTGTIFAGDGLSGPTTGVPGIAFNGATGVGFRRTGTVAMIHTASGADIWATGASYIKMRSNGTFDWSSTTDPTAASDLSLSRDAANILAQRNGTNAQTFRIYGTYTDASNNERIELDFSSSQAVLSMGRGYGTGINRTANLWFFGTGGFNVQPNATTSWTFTLAGALLGVNGTGGLGYGTGAGGAVTQATSRTTGVTLNKVAGAITLFTAAGSTTATSFTVTNSTVAATDTIIVSVKSSTTNKYLAFVSAVAAGSFEITFYTTGGTTSDAPVINFSVIKAVAA